MKEASSGKKNKPKYKRDFKLQFIQMRPGV